MPSGSGTRLYIGRLPYRCREDDIDRFFRGYGRIRDVVMKSGFAFVEFDDPRDADDACFDLNGRSFMGERVTVEHCRRIRERRTGRPAFLDNQRFISRYGPPVQTRYKLIVENLSSRVSWQDLKDVMRQAGEVTYADAHKGRMKNAGVVCFATRRDMEAALEKYDGYEMNGRKIKLNEDKRSSRSRSRSRSRRSSRSRSRSRSRRSRSRRSRSRSKRSRSRSKSKGRSRSRSSRSGSSSSRSSRSRSKSAERKKKGKEEKEKESKSRSASRSQSPKENGTKAEPAD